MIRRMVIVCVQYMESVAVMIVCCDAEWEVKSTDWIDLTTDIGKKASVCEIFQQVCERFNTIKTRMWRYFVAFNAR